MGPAIGTAATSAPPARRLAAIMFTDLVGYSALAHRDEALAIELLELHRVWVREILPRHGGIEIETVGDAFLIEFAGALAAVECALAVQRHFAEHNKSAPDDRKMQLRIGIHLGDVEHKDGKLMGDGVNIASRIHGMAEPGGICVSETVHQVLHNRAGLAFRSLGAPALKNIATPLALYRVQTGGTASGAPGVRFSWRHAAPLGVGIALCAAALALSALRLRLPVASPSVAVLPFANMSGEKDNQFFTEGIHDSVLTHLSRIRDLKVISRTSVMEYRQAARNLREIAAALGVAHVVEGSVQRRGERVRVTAQLIRAADDAHMWAENYDGEIADVFAIQSDIAQKIAAAVRARLTPAEKGAIEKRPTEDPEAWEVFLRAEHETRFFASPEAAARSLALYEEAAARDPSFALAFAKISQRHAWMYWRDYDRSAARLEHALAAARRSLELDPELIEGRLALGTYYRSKRDYAEAHAIHSRLAEQYPKNAEILAHLGYLERRRGLFTAAIDHFRRAIEGDPLNLVVRYALAETLFLTRAYGPALQEFQRALQHPGAISVATEMGSMELVWKGDPAPLTRALSSAPTDAGDTVMHRYVLHFWGGRYDAALAALDAWPDEWLAFASVAWGANFLYPTSLLRAQALRAKGDHKAARAQFLLARRSLDARLAQDPQDARLHAALAVTHAALGGRAEALSAAVEARRLMPVSLDALVGPVISQLLAQTYAWLGDRDLAIAELRKLLESPSHVTAAALRLNPVWQPLHGDPQFERLIAEHADRPRRTSPHEPS